MRLDLPVDPVVPVDSKRLGYLRGLATWEACLPVYKALEIVYIKASPSPENDSSFFPSKSSSPQLAP